MDKAPDFGSGDCRFESCHDRIFYTILSINGRLRAQKRKYRGFSNKRLLNVLCTLGRLMQQHTQVILPRSDNIMITIQFILKGSKVQSTINIKMKISFIVLLVILTSGHSVVCFSDTCDYTIFGKQHLCGDICLDNDQLCVCDNLTKDNFISLLNLDIVLRPMEAISLHSLY